MLSFKEQFLIYINYFVIVLLPFSLFIGNAVLNVNVILIILFGLYFYFKKNIKFDSFFLFIILLILLFLAVNINQSSNKILSIRGSLGLIKNFLFFVALLILFNVNGKNFELFCKSIFYAVIFVSLDTLFQFYFGFDIFGFKIQYTHGIRLSGPFGDEYVVGAYLSKLLFLSAIYLYFHKYRKNIIIVLYIFFVSIVIFLVQERSAFYLTFIACILFVLLFDEKVKIKFYIILVFFIIIIFTLFSSPSFKEKYFNQTFIEFGLTKNAKINLDNKSYLRINSFLDSRYGAHFLTAYEIFKDEFIIGSGIKTFRSICSSNEYANINSSFKKFRCNSHPHNFYLEFLSETGLIGFSFLFIFLIFLFYKCIINFSKDKNLYTLLLCSFLILFIPTQTSGSFFSTFNGIFYWFFFSIFFYLNRINFFSSLKKK